MLNELYDLWRACEPPGKPPRVDLPLRILGLDMGKRADGVRIFLNTDGVITRIEEVHGDQMKRIRKWERGSGITLPVFNFEPFHEISESEYVVFKKAVGKLSKGQSVDLSPFLRLAENEGTLYPVRWPKHKIDQLDDAFKKVSADLLAKFGEDEAEDGDGWQILLQTLPKLDAREWLKQASLTMRQFADKHCFPALADLLFHNSAKAKAGTVPVQFEMEGVKSPVYSERAQSWLIGVLARSVVTQDEESDTSGVDTLATHAGQAEAVWGMSSGSDQKYRQAELPVLGKVRLFDRNVTQKPTSIRYDKGEAIFKIGPDVRMKLTAALEWLAAAERKGRTWAVRGKPTKEGVFLLLTYLAECVENTPEHLVEVFLGPPEDELDRAVVQFETVCSGVVQALDGIPSLNAGSRIQVFALHQPDDYRTQIFASESFTQSALKMMAESWQTHCRAHPPIHLPQFTPEGEATWLRNLEPLVPFPYQAIECLNTIWEKCEQAENAKCESASDYSFADAFELLRRTGEYPTDAAYLGRVLDLAVRRALPLMTAVAHAMHQAVAKQHERKRVFIAQGDKGCGPKSLVQARRWPCLLSLLLTRLGYQPNTFMKESAYLIGRFLAQLDRLHGYYAKYVSGKEDGLRQLLGNSLMATALESPLRAFELAGQRMLPYQAWGGSFAQGRRLKEVLGTVTDDAKAANNDRWEVYRVLEEMGRIAEELSDRCIPEANIAHLAPCKGDEAGGGHESKAPAKQWLDLTETLKAKDQAWMHADSAAKAQMLLGYLARPENFSPNPKTENTPKPPDFD